MSYENMTYPERIASIATVIASAATIERENAWLVELENNQILDRLSMRLQLLKQLDNYDRRTEEQDDLRGQLYIELGALATLALDRIALGCY